MAFVVDEESSPFLVVVLVLVVVVLVVVVVVVVVVVTVGIVTLLSNLHSGVNVTSSKAKNPSLLAPSLPSIKT